MVVLIMILHLERARAEIAYHDRLFSNLCKVKCKQIISNKDLTLR